MSCQYSKIKITAAIAILGFFLVGSFLYLLLGSPMKRLAGLGGVLVFGVCLYQVMVSLFKQGPGLVVDENGIEDHQWGWGVIPWSDITAVSVKTIKNNRILSIQTQNPHIYLSKVKGPTRLFIVSNQLLGFPQICSNCNILTPGIDEVFDYIRISHPEKILKD